MLSKFYEAMDYLAFRPRVPQYSQIDGIVQEFVQEVFNWTASSQRYIR